MLTLDVLRIIVSGLSRVVWNVAFTLCESLRIQLDELGYAIAQHSAREVARVVLLFILELVGNVLVVLFIAALCCAMYFAFIPATLFLAHTALVALLYCARAILAGSIYALSEAARNASDTLYALYTLLFRYNP